MAVIRLTDGRKIPVCSGELDDYQRNRIDLVRFIQEYIHLARRGVKNSRNLFIFFFLIFLYIMICFLNKKMRHFIANIQMAFSVSERNLPDMPMQG